MNTNMASTLGSSAAPLERIVVGTRIHWNNHAQDQSVQIDATLQQVHAFCARAATYAHGIVIAVGLPRAYVSADTTTQSSVDATASTPSSATGESAFIASVRVFLARLERETSSGVIIPATTTAASQPCTVPVKIVPMLHWGSFVPALNAIVATAATQLPDAPLLLLQSLEIDVDAAGVAFLASRFAIGRDLVVGAALPGHTFAPSDTPLALSGVTTPWNTLALWDLTQLARIGFPLIGDGLKIDGAACTSAGVEEVSTIALYQHVFPATTAAKVYRVPGIAWQVEAFADDERQRWQARKMASKQQRAATQLAHFGLASGAPVVWHLE